MDPEPTESAVTDQMLSREVFTSGVTLGTFILLGVFVAFAALGVVPREVLIIAGPPILVAMFVEQMLVRLFGVALGPASWLVVYVFLYLEAVLLGFWMERWKALSEQRRRAKREL